MRFSLCGLIVVTADMSSLKCGFVYRYDDSFCSSRVCLLNFFLFVTLTMGLGAKEMFLYCEMRLYTSNLLSTRSVGCVMH